MINELFILGKVVNANRYFTYFEYQKDVHLSMRALAIKYNLTHKVNVVNKIIEKLNKIKEKEIEIFTYLLYDLRDNSEVDIDYKQKEFYCNDIMIDYLDNGYSTHYNNENIESYDIHPNGCATLTFFGDNITVEFKDVIDIKNIVIHIDNIQYRFDEKLTNIAGLT